MTYIEDYMDIDMAYLTGLIIARGILQNAPLRQIVIQFPYVSMTAKGISVEYDQETSIQVGLSEIRERIAELVDTDIKIVKKEHCVDLVITFTRNSMIWRNILLITNSATHFSHFTVPEIFFNPNIPIDWKKEFIKGFGDAAGNIRSSNNYMNLLHRVRLDVLNYNSNWELPVKICLLLQEQIGVPVQNIMWGHPNLGRAFREHMINIFADDYVQIGFSFKNAL